MQVPAAGTWDKEVEVEGGKIVITSKDGSRAVVTYSESKSPAEVGSALRTRCMRMRQCGCDWATCLPCNLPRPLT